ncbi:ABC transporter permease [Cupriavidus neocaledonicus]|uniref:Peptide transporter permease subunit: membrane component of ABC superfamily n=1 Tax=Cupriavidus neocaledonicus TaxID=1040979 RepID=A0A375HPP5_9BURK|nr:ABC transporter permease [Cupriavidus neocaledonicus]SOZ38962.1 putative peptide transporter permease subunit: membrane component of ABC superfamily [Cupriavidus neocaledonicus]SPD59395.1 putative peptide transporter permease subunit: membrane component of ABC superfamily [Cupriavidus neocaledonicus]
MEMTLNKSVAPLVIERSPGYWATVVRRLLRNKVAMAAALILIALVLMAVFAPALMPADPYASSILKRLKPVGTEHHLLGTDELGRDMLSRLMLGGRLSLFMGITPVLLAFVIGSAIGIVAGYAGGWTNTVIMRVTDVLYAFPSVLLAIALSGTLGAGVGNALLSLTIVFVPQIVRVAESVTTQLRSREFVDAARASGASALTIVRAQVLNNVLGPIFVYATSLISVSMILASGLSFLGLGVKPPEPEWGLMLNTLRTAIYTQPWVAALPGAMIFLTSISFNLLADGIRSAMEIKD